MALATLALKEVTKYFLQGDSHITVLDSISILFEQGNTYAIIGVSGTGKSTLMHIIAGLDRPSNGSVSFDNQFLADFSPAQQSKFLNRSIGLMFQLPYLINELSVLENIMIPGLIAKKSQHHCEKKALLLLEQTGIVDKAHHKPASLSGGQQQRVALARALFNKPAFLLADEPTGNLDIATGKGIVNLLLFCKQEWNMGIIITSHDAYVAHAMEITYQLQAGQLTQKKYN